MVRARGDAASPFVRAIDIESWALLIPGGFVGRVAARIRAARRGRRRRGGAGRAAAARRAGCLVVGHYIVGVIVTAIAGWRFTGFVRPEDLATVFAVAAIGLLWIRARIGRESAARRWREASGSASASSLSTMVWGDR